MPQGDSNVGNTKYTPAVLSLCSGYGGIERGLERVLGTIRVLTHVEIEAFACKESETGKNPKGARGLAN